MQRIVIRTHTVNTHSISDVYTCRTLINSQTNTRVLRVKDNQLQPYHQYPNAI